MLGPAPDVQAIAAVNPANVFATVAFLGIAAFWGETVLGSFPFTAAAKLLQTITLAWAVRAWSETSVGASREYARLLGAGLAFSILGDFFVMFATAVPRGAEVDPSLIPPLRPRLLAAGVLAFALTQVFYTRAMRRVGSVPSWTALAGIPAAFALLALANHWTLRMPLPLAAGAAVYALFLGVTVAHASAGLRNEDLPFPARRAAALGAWIFAITDGLLPVVIFGPGAGVDIPHLGLWTYQAYIVSQSFFALSAFRLRSTEV
jgi:hypothetical protein